eukprot:233637_1
MQLLKLIIILVVIFDLITFFDMDDDFIEPPRKKSKNFTPIITRAFAVSKIIHEGKSISTAAEECEISYESTRTYLIRYEKTNDVLSSTEIKKQHNPQYKIPYKLKIDTACGAIIIGLVQDYHYTLDQVVTELHKSRYNISRSAVNEYLIRCNITVKVISKIARESHPDSVIEFWEEFYRICTDFKQLFFLDETWRNDKTINKTRGRSLKGKRCPMVVNMRRGKYKINLLLACNWNGPLCWDFFAESVNEEKMAYFMWNQLARYVNRYPGPNSILIMDNHHSHEGGQIFEFLYSRGIYILYEPSHWSTINLTEWQFQAIKQKEICKGIFGSFKVAMNSLDLSIEECIGLNWKSVMEIIGFVDGISDSDD